ncbi:MAG: hypoxanthine phosphoribosyltransferase [Actinobacteria bacterium]|nr:hypoxanthine phosphoribosyltransferase [Actinomycetota bacterium]MBL7124400.1 hypoxanthine phosphoribosyltransferase [Actinomycetota bacterium]
MGLYKFKKINNEKVLIYDNMKIKVLIDEKKLRRRVRELGQEITRDYKDRDPVLVSVLRGSFIFIADICREIKIPVTFDFMAVSSYGNSKVSSGIVRITKDLEFSIENKEVIIIEDIVDSGRTLNYLVKNLQARNPKNIEVCALLDKDVPRKTENKVKYKGFDIPNKFVVGYGLDFEEKYRNFPFIGYIENEQ